MNDRAREFIDHWESENVEAVPDADKSREAERLAAMCREDAIRAGISIQDLDAAGGGDLMRNMREALEAAENRNGGATN
jgi:hypothetical protein